MPAHRGYPWCTPEFVESARAVVARAEAAGGGQTGRLAIVRELGVAEWKAQVVLQILRGTRPMPDAVTPTAFPPIPTATVASKLTADPTATILKHLRQARTVEELADLLDCAPLKVRGLLAAVEDAGHLLHEDGGTFWIDRDPAPAEVQVDLPATRGGETLRLGIVSDSHFGSVKSQPTFLCEAYKRFADAGVTTVLHAGDLLDGVDVYRGQHSESWLHTFDDQIDYAVQRYPSISEITTHIISGNHDLSGLRHNGTDPLKSIAKQRPDFNYLGQYSAWINIGPIRIYLLHPQGGIGYASTYRIQRIIEGLAGGSKPHLLLAGHWHRRAYIFERNVHGMLCACTCAQTQFEARLGLQPVIGATILEISTEDDGAFQSVTPTFLSSLVPKENDR